MNIYKKAEKAISLFSAGTRTDGTHYVFLPLETDKFGKGEFVEALRASVREAHGERLPDDFIYSAYCELLEKIAEYDADKMKSADYLEQMRSEIVAGCCDVYTADILHWLASDVRNVYYLGEAMEEAQNDGFELIQRAQYRAYDDVMGYVINFLTLK